MNWIIYDPESNRYIKLQDREGKPVQWSHTKSSALWYSDKELKKALAELAKFGFYDLEPQGVVKRK